jgi:CheY-like chemotaxis protein
VEALAWVRAGQRFDLAILDLHMPVLDGIQLAEAMRDHALGTNQPPIPVLILSSVGARERRSDAVAKELIKPVKPSALLDAVVTVLAPDAVARPGAAPGHEHGPVLPGVEHPLRILVAEDNAVNVKLALRLLERIGYTADVAENGFEVLEALQREPYDVVLMDVQMPELDGLDASRRICERWPPESRPHVIAMTANALPEDREACFAAGMNDYVAKPIRAAELAAALKRVRPLRNRDAGSGEVEISLEAAALQNLRDLGGVEFLAEVVDVFLADAPALFTSLRSSLERQDTEELRRAAHTLKSNGSTLGAAAFAELCRTVEQHARDGRLDGVSQLVDRIEQEYATLQEALASLRSEPVS